MKKLILCIISILCAIGMRAQEDFSPADNLYMNFGAGFLIGDNGQPSSISNVAVAWDINVGYWFGRSKYGGLRLGYNGDILQSFNYLGRKNYGWNTLYIDGMLNISNLIYKTKSTHQDPRWYCSPFVSVECLMPMAQNQYKTSFGIGLGIANEINVHRNVSVTLDWRNTLAMIDGVKWLPEVNAGLKLYFTGKARYVKKEDKPAPTQPNIIMHDSKEQEDTIQSLRRQLAILNEKIAMIESDTSIYHIEDKVIRDYVNYSCLLPYNHYSVSRAINLFPKINDKSIRDEYTEDYNQLKLYYKYSLQLHEILLSRQNQLSSPTFNRDRWKRGLQSDLDKFNSNISRLYYLQDLIAKVKKESENENPNFSEYITELQNAINTKK